MTNTARTDFEILMRTLAVPRLNGSSSLKATRTTLSAWLIEHEITHRIHEFRLYPYFVEIGGVWLMASQILLAISIWLRWGWPSLLIAIISWLVVIVEANGIALLSRIWSNTGENIVIEFVPDGNNPSAVDRELILSAHYDSKTELLNDRWRNFFMGKLPLAILLALIIGILGLVDGFFRQSTAPWTSAPYYLAAILTLPLIGIVLPLGVNFVFGHFAPPSEGAVDNGAACAILLSVAKDLAARRIEPERTKVTIVLFCGEEVVVQGSRAYVADRSFPHPTAAINLELMGQDGDYVIWRKVGSPFQAHATASDLNEQLANIIGTITNSNLVFFSGPAGTDSLPFAAAGIPATSLASRDSQLGFTGLHTPQDNLGRVVMSKLTEGHAIVSRLIQDIDGTVANVSSPHK